MDIPKSLFTFESLMQGDIDKVPTESGVYFIYCDSDYMYNYLPITDGIKNYKGKTTTLPVNKLISIGDKQKLSGSNILYIGKADNLRTRLRQYMNWGYDISDSPHSGGKRLWQLVDNKRFHVSYMLTDEPNKMESILIDTHIIEYHCKPFANICRGNRIYGLLTAQQAKKLLKN